jgi:hypothetical protein
MFKLPILLLGLLTLCRNLLTAAATSSNAVVQEAVGVLKPGGNDVVFVNDVLWIITQPMSTIRCTSYCVRDPACVYYTVVNEQGGYNTAIGTTYLFTLY